MMNLSRRCVCIGLGVLGSLGPAVAQDAQPGLDALLQTDAFKEAWDKVFRRERNVDRWVHVFGGGGEGTVGPTRLIVADGQRYLIGVVCRPQDCDGNKLFVLFREDGSQAWARWVVKDFEMSFGRPTGAEQALLVQAARK
jgi:hypothetical protein